MSKIEYRFRAIPDEFLTDEFIDDPIMMRFIRWIFQRIHHEPSSIPLKKYGITLELAPYEFIFGREKCASEAKISPKQVRIRMDQLKGLGFIQNVASKSASTYSVYTLVTDRFSKINGQHSGQQKGQHPGHILDNKILRSKESHLSQTLSSKVESIGEMTGTDGLTDDFFLSINSNNLSKSLKFNETREIQKQHNINYHDKEIIEIYPHNAEKNLPAVRMTQKEIERLTPILHERYPGMPLEDAVKYIWEHPKREAQTLDWENALRTWFIKIPKNNRAKENKEFSKAILKHFPDNKFINHCMAEEFHDKVKDQILLRFTCEGAECKVIDFSYNSQTFQKDVYKFLKERGFPV